MVDLLKRHEWPLPREAAPVPVQDPAALMGAGDPYESRELTFWGLSNGPERAVRMGDGWIWRSDYGR